MDDTTASHAARHSDVRIQVVLRELSQGALAGIDSQVTEYAARLVVAALDSFDYQSLQTAWGDGFRAGMAFQKARTATLNARFGSDADSLAWARGHVQALADKYRRFETDARNDGRHETATQWRKFANLLEMQLIGGSGCVITPFDERRPSLPSPKGEG
jgi:hypothetical protein